MKIQEYVDNAYKEILEKNYDEIQADTAMKWASRALVLYTLIKESEEDLDETKRHNLNRLLLGEEYRHEAIEHAGSIEDETYGPHIARTVRELMEDARNEALAIVYGLRQESPSEEPEEELEIELEEETPQNETEDKKE